MSTCPTIPLELAAAQALGAGDAALALAYGRAALIARPLSGAGEAVWAAAAQLKQPAGPHVGLIVLAWAAFVAGLLALTAATTWWWRLRRGTPVGRVRWAVGLLLALWLGLTTYRIAVARQALVADTVPARVLPEASANVATQLAAGTLVRVVRSDGDWVLVRSGEDMGWLPAAQLYRPQHWARCK